MKKNEGVMLACSKKLSTMRAKQRHRRHVLRSSQSEAATCKREIPRAEIRASAIRVEAICESSSKGSRRSSPVQQKRFRSASRVE